VILSAVVPTLIAERFFVPDFEHARMRLDAERVAAAD